MEKITGVILAGKRDKDERLQAQSFDGNRGKADD